MKNGKFVSCPKKITPKLGKGKYDRIIKKSENVLPKLKRELWEYFAEFIKLRDCKNGMFVCISCNKLKSMRFYNTGHYWKSQLYPAIRYDENNCHSQCIKCNIFDEGNRQGYEKNLRKKIGDTAMEILDRKKNNKVDYSQFVLRALISEYKNKVSSIKLQRESEHAVKMTNL